MAILTAVFTITMYGSGKQIHSKYLLGLSPQKLMPRGLSGDQRLGLTLPLRKLLQALPSLPTLYNMV